LSEKPARKQGKDCFNESWHATSQFQIVVYLAPRSAPQRQLGQARDRCQFLADSACIERCSGYTLLEINLDLFLVLGSPAGRRRLGKYRCGSA
jgi:hypothetical protein